MFIFILLSVYLLLKNYTPLWKMHEFTVLPTGFFFFASSQYVWLNLEAVVSIILMRLFRHLMQTSRFLVDSSVGDDFSSVTPLSCCDHTLFKDLIDTSLKNVFASIKVLSQDLCVVFTHSE